MKKALIIEMLHHHGAIAVLQDIYKKNYDTHFCIGEFVNSIINMTGENVFIISQPNRCKKFKLKGINKLKNEIFDSLELLKNSIKLINHIKKENPSIIHIATVENPLIVPFLFLINFIYKGKIAITIHETHYWGVEKNAFHFFDYLLYLIYWIPFRQLSKKLLYFMVLGEYVKIPNILKKKKKFVVNYRQINIPEYKYVKERIIFTITGNAETKLKNFYLIFKVFNKLFLKNPELKDEVKLVLLGKLRDPIIHDMIREYDLLKYIITFDDFIGEKQFKDFIMETDYIIIPTYKESYYGSTKISGSFGDAICLGIPFLIPTYYAKGFYFPENIIRFNDNNLAETLLDCIIIKLNED